MLINRRCMVTGRVNVMFVPVTPEQIDAWRGGVPIQHAMPHLTADQREFLLTGILPDVWDGLVPAGDDLDLLPDTGEREIH